MLWIVFFIIVIALLAVDLGIFHKKSHQVSFKEAVSWSLLWMALAAFFALGIFHFQSPQNSYTFATGYLLELSLSLDNVFVFILIFKKLHIPSQYQHRVLFWGILGALILRGLMIFLGVGLVEQFHWILYIFGVFLIYSGVKIYVSHREDVQLTENKLISFLKKRLPIHNTLEGEKFLFHNGVKWMVTPLGLALILAEVSDLVFALDSIPAIFGVTQDPFIIYTSNCFAILGLRSLYFALSPMMDKFYYLHHALSILLIFIGFKMLAAPFIELPITFTLSFILIVLVSAVLFSVVHKKHKS
jgi:tellurite resistance protein TerC